MPTTATRVFVSHSHQDIAFCRPFVAGLQAEGLDVWYDESDLLSGALREKIEGVLASCRHFIVVLSPAAVVSSWVNAEIDAALDLLGSGRLQTFLPVVAATCEIPLLIRRYRRICGPNDTALSVAEAVRQTMSALTAQPAPLPQAPALPLPSTGPTQPAHNEGIIQSGGTISAGALAVGQNARAVQRLTQADHMLTQRGWQEAREKLDALVLLVETHAHELADRGEVEQLLHALVQELTKEQPSKVILSAVLHELADRVRSIGSVSAAVNALDLALMPLFSAS